MNNSLITETVNYKGYTIAKLEFPSGGGFASPNNDTEMVIGFVTWQIYRDKQHIQNALSLDHAKEAIDGFKV